MHFSNRPNPQLVFRTTLFLGVVSLPLACSGKTGTMDDGVNLGLSSNSAQPGTGLPPQNSDNSSQSESAAQASGAGQPSTASGGSQVQSNSTQFGGQGLAPETTTGDTEQMSEEASSAVGQAMPVTMMSTEADAGAMIEPSPVEEQPQPEPPGSMAQNPTMGIEDAGTSAEPVIMGDGEIPDLERCAPVADWDPEWVQFEDEVLLLTNEKRAEGADCGTEGSFEPAGPLAADGLLRCAARLHSMDMYERDFFDHINPDGDGPGERLAALDYNGAGWGENIAGGQATPQDVVDAWMDSDGHCSNIMQPSFELLGVGYHAGAGRRGIGSNYWTQVFGAPPFMFGGGGGFGRQ